MSNLSPVAKRNLDKALQLLATHANEDAVQAIVRALRPITGGGTGIDPRALPDLAGDVTGAIGANTVTKIQNQPVSTTDPTTGQALIWDGSAYVPTGTGHTIQDEGVSLTQRTLLDFAGAGVTVTDSGGTKTLVTIPGGTGHTIEDEGSPLTARTSLNFVGAGVTATDSGGKTVVTIPGATDTDEKAKVSSNDTTPGYLNGKLVAGTGVTLTENNDGANETLTIAASALPATTRWEILVDQEAGELIWAGATGSFELIYAEVAV